MENSNQILVSVICMCYNHENYIKTALDGFLKQKTNFAYEVIVHDDASTDKSPEIIRNYAEKNPQIITAILQKENQYSKGINSTKLFVLPYVKGKYIAYCEGDDYWIDDRKLQKQVDFLENHLEYTACVHNTKIYNCQKRKFVGYISKKNIDYDIQLSEVINRGSYAYQTSSLLMRKEFFCEETPYSIFAKGFKDWPLAIMLNLNGKIRYFRDTMSVYRLFSNKTSWSTNSNGILQSASYDNAIKMLTVLKEYVPNDNLKDIDEAILRQEYYKKLANKEYKNIIKKPFNKYLREETLKRQIFFYLKGRVPLLGDIIERLFKK